MTNLQIRNYHAKDRPIIRSICRETAFRNRGYDYIFEDGEIFADYWTEYYLKYEKDLCFVAEKEGKIVGYLLGCLNSDRYMKILKKKILPKIFLKLICRIFTFRYRSKKTFLYLCWILFKSWREIPSISLDLFPAHCHCNILPEGYFSKGFSTLLLQFVTRLKSIGTEGIHVNATEKLEGGMYHRLFGKFYSDSMKYDHYSECQCSMFQVVLGDHTPMVNRVYGFDINKFFKLLKTGSKRYGL